MHDPLNSFQKDLQHLVLGKLTDDKKNAAPGKQTEVTTTITRKEDRNKNRTQSTKQNHSISIGTKSIINNVQSLIQSTKQFKQKGMFNHSFNQSTVNKTIPKNRNFHRGRKLRQWPSRFRKGDESYSVGSRDRERASPSPVRQAREG
jgi:hypothetical protein